MPENLASRLIDLDIQVRDLINELRDSLPSGRIWYQICAAMDNIGDTVLVLEAAVTSPPPTGFAAQYMRFYGVLQAVSSQQDSIEFLSETAGGSWARPAPSSAWMTLRRIRNEVTAHAAESGGAVARMSLTSDQITFMRWTPNAAAHEVEHICLGERLREYCEEAAGALFNLREKLRDRVNAGSGPTTTT